MTRAGQERLINAILYGSVAAVLVFLLSVGVFLEPKVLGGGKSPMSAELIRQTFETRVNWPLGAALTIVLMVVAVFVILLFSRIYSLRRYGAAA